MQKQMSGGNGLPLHSLRLMVPPLRLVSAAIWQTVQQRHVMDYGMLDEFVTMVTEMVPELLNHRQRAQLILGLRARLVLELCHSKPITDLQTIQPHLDRIQTLTPLWGTQATDAEVGLSESNFLGLVQTLLKDPDEREHFFQDVFPVEFGPSYDAAIQKLMWQFLSRLEKLLPVSNFQQAALLLSDVPSVLEECVESVSHPQQLKTLLQYHRDLGQLDNHDPPSSTDGDCILSALCLPPVERVVIATEVEKEGKSMDVKEREEGVDSRSGECEKNKRSSVSDEDDAEFVDPETGKVEPKYETVMVIGEDGMVQPFEDLSVGKKRSFKKPKIKTHKASGSHGEQMLSVINSKSNVIISSVLYQPSVDLQRVDTTNLILLPFLPVRRNRGLKMKTFLTQEQKQTDTEFSEKYTFKQCQICEKTFSRSADMKRHQKIHTGEPIQNLKQKESKVCCICGRMFADIEKLDRHKLVHNPLKCTMCENSFNGVKPIKKHYLDVHKFSGPFLCTYCEKSYTELSDLVRHERTHTLPYQCSHCPKKCKSSTTLAEHERIHTGEKCLCWECGKGFINITTLRNHMLNVHSKPEDKHSCSQCDKSYGEKRALVSHVKICHAGVRYPCTYCGKLFLSMSSLTRHDLIHTQERPFKCTESECGKGFRSPKELRVHMRYHTGERPYKCKICGKGFTQNCYITRHMRTHTGEKPYPCSVCGRNFSDLRVRKRHMMTHTGEKPYKCLRCEKAFSRTELLKAHDRKEH
ncbi:zinc finger protein 98 [Salmo trutta]|uniref:zinc finger protein 98 n=1 Tax=Salmo trutta TaxID=8032 RepID=UPI0011322530|nr:zinc finger protein 98-like [Salmo trutta]